MAEFEMCQNCKRDIPSCNYAMHSMHCARNVVLCPDCGEPVARAELADHRHEAHSDVKCDLCGNNVLRPNLSKHKAEECGSRRLECQFCHLDMAADGHEAHEKYCGSRTEKCPECSDFVMLKDWDEHQKMTLYHELAKRPCAEVFGYQPLVPVRKDFRSSSSAAETSIPSYLLDRTKTASDWTKTAPSSDLSVPRPSAMPSWADRSSSFADFSAAAAAASTASTASSRTPAALRPTAASHLLGLSAEPKRSHSFNAGNEAVDASSLKPSHHLGTLHHCERREDLRTVDDETDDQVKIPCEFCTELIPLHKVVIHQTTCSMNSTWKYFGSAETEDISRPLITFDDDEPPPRKATDTHHNRKGSLRGATDSSASAMTDSFRDLDLTNGARPKTRSGNSIVGKYLDGGASSARLTSPVSPRRWASIKATERPMAAATNFPRSSTAPDLEKLNGRRKQSLDLVSQPALTSSRRRTSATLPTAAKDGDLEEREKLRQMLSSLRKDPFDEDLEANDGTFFPCEFCGDPYPVEYLMRHQLSCDLNPNPVSSGDGFNYTAIRSKAAEHIALTK